MLAVAPGLADATVSGLANTPWPMFHHDQQHTGLSPYLGTQKNTIRWTYNAHDYLRGSAVMGSDGTIYVASWDLLPKLHAINPDGSPKWSSDIGGSEGAPAIGSDGTIYVCSSGDWKLYAFNPDGSQKWTCNAPGITASPVIGNDGTIYCGANLAGSGGCLYAIRDNGDSGSVKWSYPTGLINYSSPAIGNGGTIYIGDGYHYLNAITDNGTNGVNKWRFYTGGPINSSPAIGSNGTIYVGSDDGYLYAITDNVTGYVQKWRYDTGGGIDSSPAIGSDGTIYVCTNGGLQQVYAITDNVTNAILKWSMATNGDINNSSPAIGSDKTIYVGTQAGWVYAISDNVTNGAVKWSYQTTSGADIESSPAIGSDGTVYIGSYDYKLYAFGSSPIITSINPGSGNQGQTLDVTITGTYFTGATSVSFGALGSYVSVNSFTVDSDTKITANITIASFASPGTRNVSVTTPEGTNVLTGGFTVNRAGQQTQSIDTATGTGIATFTTNGGSITGLTAAASTPCGTLPGFIFPHGLFSFTISNITPGSTVTITVTLPSDMPTNTQYWKCINGQWVNATSLLGHNDSGNILTLTLTDGGLGDADGHANGTIVDPGGPAVLAPTTQPAHQVSPRQPATLKPAQMSVQYLSVTPQQATVNQPVTISTNVINTGGEAGNLVVALKINGQVEQSQVVSVGPQGTKPVKFTVTKAQPGTYTVDIGGQKGSFTILGASSTTTSKSDNVVMIAIVFCVLVIIAVVAVLLARHPA